MHLKNKSNAYVDALEHGVYDATPKTVWAALAVSLMLRINEEDFRQLSNDLRQEWKVLNENGIVPQDPTKYLKKDES
jgi:hypothetical protein